MGLKPGDKALILWGGHVIGEHALHKYKGEGQQLATEQGCVQCFYNTSGGKMWKQIIDTLKKGDIKEFMRGYPQFLFSLCAPHKAGRIIF